MLADLDIKKKYPDWWLIFLILSKPDIIGYGVKNSFTGGKHLNKKTTIPSGKGALAKGDASSGEARIPLKSARSRFHTYASQSKETSSLTGSSGDKKKPGGKSGDTSDKKVLVHEFVVKEKAASLDQKKLAVIEKQIELRLKNGEPENSLTITSLRNRQISILEKELEELDEQMENEEDDD